MTITTSSLLFRLCALCLLVPFWNHSIAAPAAPAISVRPVPSWVVPVTPAGKAPSLKDFSGGYYLTLADRQVNLESKTTYQRFVRQIVSEAGIQNGSEIFIRFDPSYERLDFHDVSIWRGGQRISQLNIRDFKVAPIESERQRFIYNGEYSASLILKDIRKGDRIDVSFSRTGWNPVFLDKYSDVIYFNAYDYIGHVHAAVIGRPDRVLHFKEFNKPPAKSTSNAGALRIYEWNLKNVKDDAYDDNVPGWYSKEPFVEVTEYASWKEVVGWGLNFYKIPPLTGALKAKAGKLKAESETKLEFIGKAIRFVQDEIRYLGVETGVNSHKPHRPEDVFNQRYGDCKDKTFLLCAILKAHDVQCEPVLVDTYQRAHLSEHLPTPLDFNHVIARIRLDGEGMAGTPTNTFIYVDATIPMQGGAVPMLNLPTYGQGLVLAQGQAKPVDIPVQHPGNIEITEDIYLPMQGDTQSVGRLEVKTAYFEGEGDSFRSEFQEQDLSEKEESYLNFYRDSYKSAQLDRVDTLEYYDQRESGNFSMFERYAMKSPWQLDSAAQQFYFDISGRTINDVLTTLPERKRKDPVFLRYPYENKYTVNVHLPRAWNVVTDKWEIKRNSYELAFESKYIEDKHIWQLTYYYKTLKDHVPVAETDQLRADVEKFRGEMEYRLNDPKRNGMDPSDVNGFMVAILIAALAFTYLFCSKMYKFSPGTGMYHEPAIHTGGWLVLVAIGVVSQPVSLLYVVVSQLNSVYLLNSGWDAFKSQGGALSMIYRITLVFEVYANVFLFGFAALLAVLFFKKRDSFPKLFVNYMAISLFITIVDTAITYGLLNKSLNSDFNKDFGELGRRIIYTAIWIPYMIKSDRVRRTFVNTYNEQHAMPVSADNELTEPQE